MTLDIPGWTHVYSGKVRDLYTSADLPDAMLVVASDRISAFDHVLEPGIPGKGELLTTLSTWWFEQLDTPNHLLPGPIPAEVSARAMLVARLEMWPVECVVRGYLVGSGWLEYQQTQTVCGIPLPAGLVSGDRLPEPIFTPAFKAPLGEHDENISFDRMIELVGRADAEALRDASLDVFASASAIAESRGLILADTKFEFGADPVSGAPVLADEVLTSDSSRYWDAETYASGNRTESFDKQIVRDWLAANWDRTGTPPALPDEVVAQTAARYRELIERLTGPLVPVDPSDATACEGCQ